MGNEIGTLRSAAAARGIKAITVEIGNPQTFQDRYIQVIVYQSGGRDVIY